MKNLLGSKLFHVCFGALVSVVLIGWVVTKADWAQVADQVAQMNYWAFIPALIVIYVHFLLRAYRWRYLLPDAEEVPIRSLFDSIMVGNFATFVLPLRAGEVIRPYFLTRESDFKFSTCFVSVVVERFFDLSMVLFSFALVLPFVPELPEVIYTGAWALSAVAVGIFVFMFAGSFFPGQVVALVEKVTSIALPSSLSGWAINFASDLLDGASVLSKPVNAVRVVGLTLVVWIFCFMIFYVFFWIFNIPASALMAVTLGVVLALAVALPSAPGFVGVFQTGCVLGFSLFGVDADIAIAYSLVLHLFQYIVFIGYGMFALSRRQLKLTDLKDRELNPV